MNPVVDLLTATKSLAAAVRAASDDLAAAAASAGLAYARAERLEVWGAGCHARTARAAAAVHELEGLRRKLAEVERLVAGDAAEAARALSEWEG